MENPTCRFCFEESEEGNPLIQPCKCIGSSQYVHRTCIQRWRRVASDPIHILLCQLCLTEYNLPFLYPLENIQEETIHPVFLFIHYVPILVTIKIALQISMYLLLYYSWNESSLMSTILLSQWFTYYFIKTYRHSFMNVRNKQLYIHYWCSLRLKDINIFPAPYLLYLLACYLIAPYYTNPFFPLYIASVPHIYTIHIHILRQINYYALDN